MKIGIIGCGNISPLYLRSARRFPALEITACADLDAERAEARAAEFGIRASSVEELLADPEVELVVNLTVPQAHAPVAMAALSAGKHVYNEKPLATTLEGAGRVLELAARRGLRVGCAPSTFLGAGVQTCRQAIDAGLIGEPVAASAFMLSRGMESWHPDPEFFYQPGGGPMFDIGPYYLTALVALLGPVRRVTGSARASFPERVVSSQPRAGTRITVTTPTHVAGVLDFASGAVASLVTSFDVWASELPKFEIYGSEGSLSLQAPNLFGGPVRVWRAGESEWRELPLVHPYATTLEGWSLGVADMAAAILTGRPHRASGELAYHVLESMEVFFASSTSNRHLELRSSCRRPEPLGSEALEVRTQA